MADLLPSSPEGPPCSNSATSGPVHYPFGVYLSQVGKESDQHKAELGVGHCPAEQKSSLGSPTCGLLAQGPGNSNRKQL